MLSWFIEFANMCSMPVSARAAENIPVQGPPQSLPDDATVLASTDSG